MTEQERYLLKYVPPLTDEELSEIPALLCKALAENSGSFGHLALAAQLWKALVAPDQSVLERMATEILDLWDMRALTVDNAMRIPDVTRTFIDFRDALRDVRVERLNQQFSAKEKIV